MSSLQSEVLQSPALNVSPRHQLNEIEGPGGRTNVSVDYYSFILWGDLVCVLHLEVLIILLLSLEVFMDQIGKIVSPLGHGFCTLSWTGHKG